MTNVSYAVAPSNASQEYFSNISAWARVLSGRLRQTAKGAVLSLQRSVDNTAPLLYLRRQAVSPVVTSGCPSSARAGSPVGTRANTASQANQVRRNQAERPKPKKVKRLTYEATPDSARVKRLCFWPAQAHPRIRHRRIHSLEPQAPLHVHHAERKTKTNVFEVD